MCLRNLIVNSLARKEICEQICCMDLHDRGTLPSTLTDLVIWNTIFNNEMEVSDPLYCTLLKNYAFNSLFVEIKKTKNKIMFTYLLFLCVVVPEILSKRVSQSIRVNQVKKWRYLTKFGSELGKSTYQLKLRLTDFNSTEESIPLRFQLFLDDDWDTAIQVGECNRWNHAKIKQKLLVPTNGSEVSFKGSLNQEARRHMWYFAIEDCSGNFSSAMVNASPRSRLVASLHILNTDDSEFTTEENGIGYILAVLAMINFFFLINTLRQIQKEYKTHEEWDKALIILFIAMASESLHHMCALLHIQKYAGDGIGIPALSTISDIMEIFAAFLVTVILIMLASGWSIDFESLLKFDVLIPLGLVVGMGQMMIIGLAKITDDHQSKYHKYEGWQGYTIMVLYLGQYAYFLGNIITTRYQTENIKRFMIQLAIYGSLYLLSFPIFFVIVHVICSFEYQFVAPYVRQKVIVYGTQLIRLLATALLMRMFTSKTSTYYQISYKNRSFLDRSKFE